VFVSHRGGNTVGTDVVQRNYVTVVTLCIRPPADLKGIKYLGVSVASIISRDNNTTVAAT